MKKQTKIIVLILSLVLLAGSCIAVAASGGAPELTVYSKNISYESNVKLVVAVKKANVGDAVPELLVWNAKPDENTEPTAVVASAGTRNVWGEECDIYYTPGINSKNLADVIYVKARAMVNGEYVYSELEKYSVVEYCKEMIYTEGTKDDCDAEFAQIIEYGASVQRILGHNLDKLATDFKYVAVDDGYLSAEDGDAAVVFKGNKVSPVFTGNVPVGKEFSGWVDKKSGTVYPKGTAIAVTGDLLLAPEFTSQDEVLTFDGMQAADLEAINDPATTSYATHPKDQAFVPFATEKYNNIFKSYMLSNKTDTFDEPVLSIEKKNADVDDYSLKFTTDGRDGIAIAPIVSVSDYNHFVYSCDYTFLYTGTDDAPYVVLRVGNAATSDVALVLNLTYDTTTGDLKVSGKDVTFATVNINDPETPRDLCATFNFKVEYFRKQVVSGKEDYLMRIYVNNSPVLLMDTSTRHGLSTTEAMFTNTDGVNVAYGSFFANYPDWPAVRERWTYASTMAYDLYKGAVYLDNVTFSQSIVDSVPEINMTPAK